MSCEKPTATARDRVLVRRLLYLRVIGGSFYESPCFAWFAYRYCPRSRAWCPDDGVGRAHTRGPRSGRRVAGGRACPRRTGGLVELRPAREAGQEGRQLPGW